MQNFSWELTHFAAGMHTEPARIEGGTQFARNVTNLRANQNGHLVPRFPFATIETRWDAAAITGIAAAPDYLLYLLENGQLWIRFNDEGTDRLVIGTANMAGKLSLIAEYQDFAIIKAEEGSAYWIDLRRNIIQRNRQVDAYPLGLDAPTWQANTQNIQGTPGSLFELGNAYIFRWTIARAFANSPDAFIENRLLTNNAPPFSGMESNPGPAQVFAFLSPDDITANLRTFRDTDGRELHVNVVREPYATLNFTDIQHTDDRQATGVFLYQSQAVLALRQTLPDGTRVSDLWVDDLIYRRINYLPRGTTSVRLGARSSAEHWPDHVQLQFDNDKLPEEVKTLALYRDRLFAPTAEGLRYSAVRFGTPVHWAFPKTNLIRRPVVAGIEHRGVLLFGAPAGLFRLTGASEYDFDLDRIGQVGPVSSHSMGALADTIGFTGRAGFYVTDGVTVQKVSEALKRDFEKMQAVAGFCEVLPNQTILFAADLEDNQGTARQALYHFDNGAWFEITGQSIQQFALSEHERARLFCATDQVNLTELLWQYDDATSDDDAPITWSWESQYLDWNSERFKHFRWLEIAGRATSVLLASQQRFLADTTTRTIRGWRFGNKVVSIGTKTWVEDTAPAQIQVSAFVDEKLAMQKIIELTRDELRPLRIPINRRGIAIRIKLEGLGALTLRGLKLEVAA